MTKSGKRWMTLMKKLKLILVNFIITYFIIINPIKARETISGKVRVIDGDTIVINGFFQKAGIPGKKIKNQKIRLFGIDAPEMKQICKDNFAKKYECGVKSKEFLEKLILKKLMTPKNLVRKLRIITMLLALVKARIDMAEYWEFAGMIILTRIV